MTVGYVKQSYSDKALKCVHIYISDYKNTHTFDTCFDTSLTRTVFLIGISLNVYGMTRSMVCCLKSRLRVRNRRKCTKRVIKVYVVFGVLETRRQNEIFINFNNVKNSEQEPVGTRAP